MKQLWKEFVANRVTVYQIVAIILAALAVQGTARQALGRTLLFTHFSEVWGQREDGVLANRGFPGSTVFEWALHNTSPDDRFLIYRQAEFAYYLDDRRWIYDFDPKILDFYDLDETDAAHQYMLDRGVNYVFVPNYMPSTLYNSQMAAVLGDPAYANELIIADGFRMFRLHETPRPWNCVDSDMLNGGFQTMVGARLGYENRGGDFLVPDDASIVGSSSYALLRTADANPGGGMRPIGGRAVPDENGDPELYMIWDRNDRDRVAFVTGEGQISQPPDGEFDRNEISGVQIELTAQGIGYLEIWIYEFTADGAWNSRRIFDTVIQEDRGETTVHAQASFQPTTTSARIYISNGGFASGELRLGSPNACLVAYEDGRPDSIVLNTGLGVPVNDRLPDDRFSSSQEWFTREEETVHLAFGTRCHRLSVFCRQIDETDRGALLLMHRSAQGGLEVTFPDSGGFQLFTAPIETGPRTWLECRASQRIWLLERFPFRDGTLVQLERRILGNMISNNPDRHDTRRARLHLDASVPYNSNVVAMVHWDRPGGGRGCTWLGPQTASDQTRLSWEFDLPANVGRIEPIFRYDNQLSNSGGIRISRAHLEIENQD